MPPVRPHLLFINCHDLGRHLGCYGVDSVVSPRLDDLAREGVRFSQSFCTAPQCSPSRSSMFTGRYPHANGVMGLVHANFAWDFGAEEIHLAERLGSAGYRTALVGHQHETRRPELRGWQTRLTDVEEDDVAATAVSWLEQALGEGDEPCYLQVGFVRPHRMDTPTGYAAEPDTERGVTVPPYLVDEPSAREDFAAFQGDIRALDGHVGTILDALDRLGIRENTWVIFTTDHGIPYPRAKCALYDPGLETSLMMRWPAGFAGERVIDDMVSNVDFVPTIVEMLDLEMPEGLHGQSFGGALREAEGYAPRTEIFGEMTYHTYYDPRRCVRTRRQKLVVNFAQAPFFMDPSQQWRPKCRTVTPEDPTRAFHDPVEFYDLEADPLESTNRFDDPDYQGDVATLMAQLKQWMEDTQDPLLQGAVASPLHHRAMRMLREGAEQVQATR